MDRNEILNLFYNNIIPEAYKGRVNCYFIYNIFFYTRIPEMNIDLIPEQEMGSSFIVPTLYIRDYKKFNDLLIKYVDKALKFYDNSNFDDVVLMREHEGICKEKVIMTLLWSNATIEDFQNPCDFLRRRINYFELGELDVYRIPKVTGYSEVLGAHIECTIKKAKLENETPYYLETFLLNPENNEKIYEFPRVYFGISEGIANVYAIQNSKNRLMDEKFSKKIERKMYKVNDGLDVVNDTYENYGVGNLKDITPSFLVAANIFSGLIKNCNIFKMNIPSILISRWNGKIMTIKFKEDLALKKGQSVEEVTKLVDDLYAKNIALQINLTDKFLRVFRRLGYHHSSIAINGYPMDFDSNLSLVLYNQDDVCNNKLLEETFNVDKNNILKK